MPGHPRVVHLYGSQIPSGNVWKVQVMLAHLGARYETTLLDIMAKPSRTRTPEFLAMNPNGRVPVVRLENGEHLPESNAILFYLAEGTPYLPADPLSRARVLQWMFFEQYSHEPYVAVLKFWKNWGGLQHCRPEDIERWTSRGQAALDVMEGHLEDREFFVDERYSIADIALFAYTEAAADTGFRVGPAVAAWLDRVAAQPGWIPLPPDER